MGRRALTISNTPQLVKPKPKKKPPKKGPSPKPGTGMYSKGKGK